MTPKVFIASALTSKTNKCIEWIFAKDQNGYGILSRRDGLTTLAHRRVRIFLSGEDYKHLDVAHSCGNPSCINPRHLRWDTRKGNMNDTIKHGTKNYGETAYQSRLTEEDVMYIRRCDDTSTVLAKKYDMAKSSIRNIRQGRSWKHLLPPSPS